MEDPNCREEAHCQGGCCNFPAPSPPAPSTRPISFHRQAANPASPVRLLSGPLGPFRLAVLRRVRRSSTPFTPLARSPSPRASPRRFLPRSRSALAGARRAAYKRDGARASSPIPAAERTARSGGRGVASVLQPPQHPTARRTHGLRLPGAGEGVGGRAPGGPPLGGSRVDPGWGGAGARTGEPGGPRSSRGRCDP